MLPYHAAEALTRRCDGLHVGAVALLRPRVVRELVSASSEVAGAVISTNSPSNSAPYQTSERLPPR